MPGADHAQRMSNPHGRATLVVERNGHSPQRVALDGAKVSIGRAPTNDVHVPEAHISKNHAEIRSEAEGYVLYDVGSRAGVFVNGNQIQRHRLRNGDKIELSGQSPVRMEFQTAATIGLSTLELTMVGAARDTERGAMGRLARFFEFSRKLGGGFSLDEVLQDVLDLAVEVTHAERGVLLLQRADGTLERRLARTAEGRTVPSNEVRISETLAHKAFELGRASIFDDVSADADLAIAESIVSLELRSAVILPLLRFVASGDQQTATSKVFGVLYLDSKKQRSRFDGFDMRILERLAQDASSVIENARLLGEEEDKKRIARELQMASEVQAALMPERFRSTPTFEVAGTWVPCLELGGDYVDQFDLGNGRQALVVADVCGKGIAASLLAATLQGALAAEMTRPGALGEIVARANRVHHRLAPVGKFITMAILLLEPDGSVTIVNAGHCPILHKSRHGVQGVMTGGMALGLDEDAEYDDVALQLAPGDTLLVYTDGVLEAENASRELFGDARLENLMREHGALPAEALLQRLTQEVEQFCAGAPATDDLTALVVRRR